ncbi:Ribosomal large subunit pseudouridine synthase B [gamma proteobacterium HdN1]|nr:Ribosomal large subunit pseudouridine synthase B [gamma proteobacterium HdN1]
MSEKLQKVLARAGIGSRRSMEDWIASGRVSVNGKKAKVGDRVERGDVLRVDGRSMDYSGEDSDSRRMIIYYKPEGEVCTRTDPEGRPTVFDRLPRLDNERWVAVGRLDVNTQGLLLFTTDGDLANRLMHPSSEIEREYAARIFGEVTPEMLHNLRTGVQLFDGPAHFDEILHSGGEGMNAWYHVIIKEGRRREVRRMWETQGVQVSRLIRVRYGCVTLPRGLKAGRWEELSEDQISELAQLCGAGLRKRTGLYGRPKMRAEKEAPPVMENVKRGGYLRRRRY